VTFFCAKDLILFRTTSIPLEAGQREKGGTKKLYTSHQTRSAREHHLCTRLRASDELDNVCLLFFRYLADPAMAFASGRWQNIKERTDIII